VLAAILFQSPFVAALLLLICGLLLGYALGTGRMQESDALATIVSTLQAQALPCSTPTPPTAITTSAEPVLNWGTTDGELTDATALQDALATAEHDRATLAAALQAAHEELDDLQEDLASHRRAVETIERYRHESQAELAREQERSQLLETRCREQESLLSTVDAACDELNELRARNAYLQAQLAAATEGHRQAQLEWKTADGEIGHYQEQIRLLQQQQRTMALEIERIRTDRESLLVELRSAQEQNRQLCQQLGDQETHAKNLQEEIETLRVLQSYWESGEASRLGSAHPQPVSSVASDADATRVQELEELVGVLREQLRLVQLQAQEMVQRQQKEFVLMDVEPHEGTTGGLSTLPQVLEPAANVTPRDQDRRELVERIRQQNQRLTPPQEEAA
jgi:hypothetical protein